MKHYIIVKFKSGTDVQALAAPVRAVFAQTLAIPGVHDVQVRLSNSDRSNRYDMMIVMDMDREVLPLYDVSAPHLQWKAEYGEKIEKKAIFDCDNS